MPKKLLVILLCGGSFVLGVASVLLVQHFSLARSVGRPGSQNGVVVRMGEWGALEELEIPLGDSADLFGDRPARLAKTRWFFENYSKEQLETLLRSCNLTEAQWALLQQTNVVMATTNGFLIMPPDQLVWTLNPAGRQKLYEVLGKTGDNYAQNFPFRFSPSRLEERLEDTRLPAVTKSRIRSLTYTNADFVCFADLQLLPGILTTNELDHVSEALYRVPAYRLRLRIMPDSDIDTIVKYWGRNGREKFIRPLLESLARVPDRTNGVSINISYFMPPTARLRLFTYPDAWPDPSAERQDCFWTSLNFFRDPPDARFFNSQHSRETLQSEYHVINKQPTFGDLVVLLDQAGNGMHACVYIADDIVFTKNGMNRLQPWVFMKIPDMLAYFSGLKPGRMVIFRHKDISNNSQTSASQGGPIPANGKGL